MNKSALFILLAALTTLGGCFDGARERRSITTAQRVATTPTAYPNNQPTGGSIILPGGTGGNGGTNTPTPTPTDPASLIPEELKHCSWSTDGVNGFASTHNHLGAHTICQNKNNELDIHIQVRTPITDAQICVFPTYHSAQASIYIGEARCFMASNSKTIYKVSLIKNRPGYTNFKVTGVIVMKDKAYFYPPPYYQYALAPDAYLFCSQFLDQYKDSSYCTAFRSVGEYVYVQF